MKKHYLHADPIYEKDYEPIREDLTRDGDIVLTRTTTTTIEPEIKTDNVKSVITTQPVIVSTTQDEYNKMKDAGVDITKDVATIQQIESRLTPEEIERKEQQVLVVDAGSGNVLDQVVYTLPETREPDIYNETGQLKTKETANTDIANNAISPARKKLLIAGIATIGVITIAIIIHKIKK